MEEIRDTIIFVEAFADTINSYKVPRSTLRNRLLRLNAIKAIDITQSNKIIFNRKGTFTKDCRWRVFFLTVKRR